MANTLNRVGVVVGDINFAARDVNKPPLQFWRSRLVDKVLNRNRTLDLGPTVANQSKAGPRTDASAVVKRVVWEHVQALRCVTLHGTTIRKRVRIAVDW